MFAEVLEGHGAVALDGVAGAVGQGKDRMCCCPMANVRLRTFRLPMDQDFYKIPCTKSVSRGAENGKGLGVMVGRARRYSLEEG